MIGFTTYIDESIPIKPTLEELVAALTAPQKTEILNAYVDKLKPGQTKHIAPKVTVKRLYDVMEDIEQTCRAQMENSPGNITELRELVAPLIVDKYEGVFTTAQINSVIGKVVLVSKKDVNGEYVGDFASYETG